MNKKFLKNFTYLYLILPVTIFIIGWVKLSISIVLVSILITIIVKIMKENNKEEEKSELIATKKSVAMIFLIVLSVCIWGGLGGFFYQSCDWYARNIIFRDLINFKWPVFYESNNSALTYYIGIWMVPAVVGKVFLFLGENIAWRVRKYCLITLVFYRNNTYYSMDKKNIRSKRLEENLSNPIFVFRI